MAKSGFRGSSHHSGCWSSFQTQDTDCNFSLSGMIFNERDQELRDLGYQKHAFNMLISNRLGYHRDVPDTRNAEYGPLASDEFQWQCFIPSKSRQGQCPDFALSTCHARTVTWSHPYHSCCTVVCECNDAVLELAVCLRSFQLSNLNLDLKKKSLLHLWKQGIKTSELLLFSYCFVLY